MVGRRVYSSDRRRRVCIMTKNSAFRWVFNLRVLASMVEQRAPLTAPKRLDMADDDAMVAAREDVDDAAVDPAERVVEYWRASGGEMRGGITEVAARVGMPSEAFAQIELVFAEHVHGEVAIAQHHLMQIR